MSGADSDAEENQGAVVAASDEAKSLAKQPAEDGRKKVKKIVRRKRRPARPQIDASEITEEPPPQTGIVFNIWYNKWSGGDREDKYLSQTHAKGRCDISTDAGYTRGDSVNGCYFCIFFARGLCPKGSDCDYLHRLPGLHDHFNPNTDCFGRSKHSDYRDDMDGVGSFMRQNKTLYVGRIVVTDDVEEVVARHFQEWGEIERIRVLGGRGVAFVTYLNEANAQFAKEAMSNQRLDNDEVLNVRWAIADPNPQAQKREARKIEEQAAEAVRRALPADYVAEIEGRAPKDTKRRRIQNSHGLEGYDAPDAIRFSLNESTTKALPSSANTADTAAPTSQSNSDLHIEQNQTAEAAPPAAPAGLFDGSLAARYQSLAAAKPPQASRNSGAAKALVGYGSDDDDDDSDD